MQIQTSYRSDTDDWVAVDKDTYDGLFDGNNSYGVGDTPDRARDDLLFQIDYNGSK